MGYYDHRKSERNREMNAQEIANIASDKWGSAFGADYLAIMNGSMYGGIGPFDTAYAVTSKEDYVCMAEEVWEEMCMEGSVEDATWEQAVNLYKDCEAYTRLEMLNVPELLALVEENTPESFKQLGEILFEAGEILDNA
jgi:hypothetical protein